MCRCKTPNWGVRHCAHPPAHRFGRKEGVRALLAAGPSGQCGLGGHTLRMAARSPGGGTEVQGASGWDEGRQPAASVGEPPTLETGAAQSLTGKDHRPCQLGHGSETGIKCRL